MRQLGKTGKTNGLYVGGFLVLLLILGILSYGVMQTSFAGKDTTTEIIAGTGCSNTPTIDVSVVNALDRGTAVAVDAYGIVNGQYIGNISGKEFVKGDKVTLLLSATDYLDKVVSEFTVGCDVNRVSTDIYATDDMTISIKDDAGTSTLTDAAAGGAVNETAMSAGGSKSWKVEFTGKDKKASGDLIYVVELGSEANISSITMSDANGAVIEKLTSVPTGLTTSGSNTARYAFKIAGFENAVKKTVYLNVAMNSGKVISGAVYTTAYSAQAFTDDNGKFVTSGVSDASGDVKYEDDYDYDFFINAA